MKLHLTQAEGKQLIKSYRAGAITINYAIFNASLIITPDEVIEDWQVTDFNQLNSAHFAKIATLKPELVLLGTGSDHRFVHPKLVNALTEINISVECMTTDAACRTYNILMSEGRFVVAGLII